MCFLSFAASGSIEGRTLWHFCGAFPHSLLIGF
jgi:hypothetical protein